MENVHRIGSIKKVLLIALAVLMFLPTISNLSVNAVAEEENRFETRSSDSEDENPFADNIPVEMGAGAEQTPGEALGSEAVLNNNVPWYWDVLWTYPTDEEPRERSPVLEQLCQEYPGACDNLTEEEERALESDLRELTKKMLEELKEMQRQELLRRRRLQDHKDLIRDVCNDLYPNSSILARDCFNDMIEWDAV